MAYYGDISLWQSIRMVAGQPAGVAELYFLEPTAALEDRRAAAEAARQVLLAKQQSIGAAVSLSAAR